MPGKFVLAVISFHVSVGGSGTAAAPCAGPLQVNNVETAATHSARERRTGALFFIAQSFSGLVREGKNSVLVCGAPGQAPKLGRWVITPLEILLL